MSNKNGSHWIRPVKRLAIYIRDNFTCVYCGKNLKNAKPKLRTLDHVLPRELGGSNRADNLVTACKRCNDAKGIKNLADLCVMRKGDATLVLRVHNALRADVPIMLAKQIMTGDV